MKMMRVGSTGAGAGGNTPSTSNLSASAPPFMVDRANPMIGSNPVFHYPEMSYTTETFDRTSQFSRPSAPSHEVDFNFTSSGISSTSMASRPCDAYWYTPSAPANTSGDELVYGGELNRYYSSSVPMIGEDNPIMETDGRYRSMMPSSISSPPVQFDCPQWFDDMGTNKGKWIKPHWFGDTVPYDGKWIESAEPFGSSSSKNVNAGHSRGYDSDVNQGRYDVECGIKSPELSGVPYGNLGRHPSGKDFIEQSLGMRDYKNNPSPAQNVDFFPYDNTRACLSPSCPVFPQSHYFGQSSDTIPNISLPQNIRHPYDECVMPVDSSISNMTSSMRSSPSVVIRPPSSVNDLLGKNDTSYEPQKYIKAAVGQHVDLDGFPKQKYSDLKSNSYINEDSQLYASEEELLNPLYTNNTCISKSRKIGSLLLDLDVQNVLAATSDTIPAAYSADDSSDLVDYYHPAVDSPCWKGALSSQFPRVIGEFDGNLDCDDRNGVTMSDSTLRAEASVGISIINNGEGLLMGNQAITSTNKSCFQNQLMGSFDANFFDDKNFNAEEKPAMDSIDTSEGGLVAVHAAEKVLSFPPSLEVGPECSKLRSDTKFDVESMIKCMHTTSEWVRDYLSSDPCAVETNSEILNDIISNINACLRKNGDNSSNKMEKSDSYVKDNSEKHGTARNVSSTTIKPRKENVATGESSTFSPFNLTRDDVTAEAIKKALLDNFHCNEEISAQALTFKNLWLEAEARLCSINYMARFDRLKIERGKFDEANLRKESNKKGGLSLNESLPISHARSVTRLQPNTFVSNGTEHSNDIGSSIMDRLSIQNARCDNRKLVLTEGEKGSKMTEAESAGSMVDGFNILRSQENNLASTDTKKEQPPQMVDVEHAESVMARFSILKARKDYQTPTSSEKSKPEMLQGQNLQPRPVGVNIFRSTEGSSTKEEKHHQIGDFNESVILDGNYGYLHRSLSNEPSTALQSHDSSSWEHIQKNDCIQRDF